VRGDYKRRWWRGKLQKQGKGRQSGGEPAANKGGVDSRGIQSERPKIAESAVKAFILDVVNADDKKIDDSKMYFFSQYPEFFCHERQGYRGSLADVPAQMEHT
jgi:hypothetical protein